MNFLGLEPLIVERLVERLDGTLPARSILTAPDLMSAAESQTAPAVYVVYLGCRINQETGGGRIAEFEQRWVTVIAVRNARDVRSGQAARAEAGPLMGEVFEALAGWTPGASHRALRPATPPASGYTKGFSYHPLEWLARFQARGQI